MPDTEGGGDPITNTVLQYREQEGAEWQPVDGIVQGNRHSFSGEQSFTTSYSCIADFKSLSHTVADVGMKNVIQYHILF